MAMAVRRLQPCGINVLVSGAGVGGLMAALECWRHGMNVRIVERSPQNITTGDSFAIGPSAVAIFQQHWPEMEARRQAIGYNPSITICNEHGERIKGPIKMNDMVASSVPREKLVRMQRYSRPAFHTMLLEQASKIGLQVEYGNEVVDYFEDVDAAQAGASLKDGSRLLADVVIAADGVRTKSWSLVAGEPVPARSSGRALFRVAYPIEHALADAEIAERFNLNQEGATVENWSGPNGSFTFAKTKDIMGWAMDHADTGTAEESWTPRVDVEEVLKVTASIPGWPKAADKVIKLTPGGKLVDWKLMWRDPQPRWTSPGGRVIQLGDAAHTFLPTSGNGATQALEDAASLATCLSLAAAAARASGQGDGGDSGAAGVPEATRVHNLLRFERVSFLQALGVANREARAKSGKTGSGKMLHVGFGNWIIGHDPAQYAKDRYEEARAHLADGTPFRNSNTPTGVEYRPWTIDSLTSALEKDEPTILDGDWS